MSKPGFTEGAVAALLAALGASVCMTLATPLLGFDLAMRAVISLLTALYAAYLVMSAQQATGRITLLVTGCTALLLLWSLQTSFALFLLSHVFSVWLIRCVYFYRSALPCLYDAGLQLLALAALKWAALQSASAFLSVWTFFLIQALSVLLPPSRSSAAKGGIQHEWQPPTPGAASNSALQSSRRRFNQSAGQAEAALKILFRQ